MKLLPGIFFLIFMALLFVGCNVSEEILKDGDEHITEEMNEIISDYIIQKYSEKFLDTDRQFEVHRVYGTGESEGILSIYMWSTFRAYNKSANNEKAESFGGHTMPVVIRLSKIDDTYSVSEYIELISGSLFGRSFESSLKKNFPERYFQIVKQEFGTSEDLKKEMDEKVKQWLGKQG